MINTGTSSRVFRFLLLPVLPAVLSFSSVPAPSRSTEITVSLALPTPPRLPPPSTSPTPTTKFYSIFPSPSVQPTTSANKPRLDALDSLEQPPLTPSARTPSPHRPLLPRGKRFYEIHCSSICISKPRGASSLHRVSPCRSARTGSFDKLVIKNEIAVKNLNNRQLGFIDGNRWVSIRRRILDG